MGGQRWEMKVDGGRGFKDGDCKGVAERGGEEESGLWYIIMDDSINIPINPYI